MKCTDEHVGAECPKKCPCLCDGCYEYCQKEKQRRAGRRSRRKGKDAQKKVATELRVALGLSEDDLFSAVGGSKEDDVRGSAEFQRLFPFRIEVKNEKTVRMPAWIEQAEVDNHQLKSKKPWLLLFKMHGNSKFFATIKFEELLKLIKKE